MSDIMLAKGKFFYLRKNKSAKWNGSKYAASEFNIKKLVPYCMCPLTKQLNAVYDSETKPILVYVLDLVYMLDPNTRLKNDKPYYIWVKLFSKHGIFWADYLLYDLNKYFKFYE